MNVLTSNPVLINSKRINYDERYLAVDGNSGFVAIKSFQQFANKSGWLPKLVEDGLWGPFTKKAADVHGLAFDKLSMPAPAPASTTTPAPTSTTTEPTEAQKKEAAKKGAKWDKTKGWVDRNGQKMFGVLSNLGILDALRDRIGGGSQQYVQTGVDQSTPPDSQGPKKMSKNVKIVLAVVGAVALITIVALVVKSSKKNK